MKNKRRVLFTTLAIVVLLAVAAAMFVVGRGHTVYFDNKKIEYNGQEYKPFHKVVVNVNGEQAAKLSAKDRGKADTMGQTFSMQLVVTREKGADEEYFNVTLPLPYEMDGILINLPALLNGLDQSAYMSEFVIEPVEEESEEVQTDEFGIEIVEEEY